MKYRRREWEKKDKIPFKSPTRALHEDIFGKRGMNLTARLNSLLFKKYIVVKLREPLRNSNCINIGMFRIAKIKGRKNYSNCDNPRFFISIETKTEALILPFEIMFKNIFLKTTDDNSKIIFINKTTGEVHAILYLFNSNEEASVFTLLEGSV